MAYITNADMIAIIATGDYVDADKQIESFILMGKEKREKLVDLMIQEMSEDDACEILSEALKLDWEEFTASIDYAEQLLNLFRADANNERWKVCKYLETPIDNHITEVFPEILDELTS